MGELEAEWRAHFARHLQESPRHPAMRDFLRADLQAALRRLVPVDARVLEVGCGTGDLVAALPNRVRAGLDTLPEAVAEARRRHPDVDFSVGEAGAGGDGRRFDAVICDRLAHSTGDVRGLLAALQAHLDARGRIFLTTFNALWEMPASAAEALGWKLPSPTANWLGSTDYDNLFAMTGLEVVRHDDRLLLPADLAGLGPAMNRFAVKLPGWRRLALYRIYVLRPRQPPLPGPAPVSVSVVVPARNEAGNIEAAVARIPAMGSRTEVLFVEGGSSDGTWERIEEVVRTYRGPLALRALRQTGRGKGDAVRLGFSQATGDLLMILDADLTVPPEDLPVFHDVVAGGQADFAQGTRLVYPMESGAMQFMNKLGNMAFSQLFTHLLDQPIRDTLCGTKVLWRSDYQRIAATRHVLGDFDPFGDFDLLFGAVRLNLKIVEVPVRYRERTYGATNIERWKHGWLLLKMCAVAAGKIKYV